MREVINLLFHTCRLKKRGEAKWKTIFDPSSSSSYRLNKVINFNNQLRIRTKTHQIPSQSPRFETSPIYRCYTCIEDQRHAHLLYTKPFLISFQPQLATFCFDLQKHAERLEPYTYFSSRQRPFFKTATDEKKKREKKRAVPSRPPLYTKNSCQGWRGGGVDDSAACEMLSSLTAAKNAGRRSISCVPGAPRVYSPRDARCGSTLGNLSRARAQPNAFSARRCLRRQWNGCSECCFFFFFTRHLRITWQTPRGSEDRQVVCAR